MRTSDYLRLYLVTDSRLCREKALEDVVASAIRGGVTAVQLREKSCSTREFYTLALRLKTLLHGTSVPLIINDRLDIALACDADGLHIGQSDMPYDEARRWLGYDRIIGLSVESLNDIEQANALDVDYVGISPVFGTLTKTDTGKPFGLEGLKLAADISQHPMVGIGGIHLDNAADVIANGADGIAVVSEIMCAENPALAAENLLKRINSVTRVSRLDEKEKRFQGRIPFRNEYPS
jgi:thiamine-phosphate pyrophosphorylase